MLYVPRMVLLCLLAASFCRASVAAEPPVAVTLNEPALPRSAGYHVIKATAQLGDKKIPLASGLFLPTTYFKTKERLPIVMTLHTRGNSGADGGGGLTGEGLGLLLGKGGADSRASGDKPIQALTLPTDAEFIGLIPQCPAGYGWESPQMGRVWAEFITQVAKAGHGDEDRVYLTGFSYGGSSTWAMALQVPGRFAAIAPLDGRATHDPASDVKKLSHVAIYLSVGDDDDDFIPESRRMHDALIAAQHPRFIYHTVHGGNHWCYGCVYTDPAFWKWMFAQRRGRVETAMPATQPGNSAMTTTREP